MDRPPLLPTWCIVATGCLLVAAVAAVVRYVPDAMPTARLLRR